MREHVIGRTISLVDIREVNERIKTHDVSASRGEVVYGIGIFRGKKNFRADSGNRGKQMGMGWDSH